MVAKNKYFTHVQPNLDQVREFAKKGATDLEIATMLGISSSAFYNYLNTYVEFRVVLMEGRKTVVQELKRTLLTKALGYTYTETRETVKDDGTNKVKTTEVTTKQSLPSENAIAILLRQYDKDFLDRDQTTTQLRKKELELKRDIAESNYFLDEECDEKAQIAENINKEEM